MRASWLTGPLLALVVLALLPARAYAHHCHTAQHCFEQGQPAAAWVVAAGVIGLAALSIAIDLNPYTSFARGAIGAVTGRDPITGAELGTWERVLGVIPIVGRAGGALRMVKRLPRSVDRTIDAFNKTQRYLDYASDLRGATGAITGKDPWTGESLSPSERVTSGLGAVGADALAGGIEATDSPASELFKARVTGTGYYPVRGGGEQLRADGIRQDDGYLQEAKHGGSPEHSPYIDGSDAPSSVRDKIRQQAEDEVYKHGRVINDPDSPYQGVEYITNDEGAKRFYEDLLNKHGVPGHVRVEE